MTESRYRRWLQFRLRTMFMVVTLWGLWLGYAANWIMQRHVLLNSDSVLSWSDVSARAPCGLWLLGEKGHGLLWLNELDDAKGAELAQRARRLFPESQVVDLQADVRASTTDP